MEDNNDDMINPESVKYKKYRRILRSILRRHCLTIIQLYILVYELDACTTGYITSWVQQNSRFFKSESAESVRTFIEFVLAKIN